MKKIIIVSVVLGIIFSLFMFKNYKRNETKELVQSEAYFLQVGAFKNYKNVTNITKMLPNYLVIKEKDLYHVYVGISKKLKNIEKIKVYYNKNVNNIYVRTKNVFCEDFIKSLETYDYLLSSTDDKDTIYTINKEILRNYDEKCISKEKKIVNEN